MADHAAVDLGDQRDSQRFGLPERSDDEVLGLVADFQRLERGDGHVSNGIHVGGRFVPNSGSGGHRSLSTALRIRGIAMTIVDSALDPVMLREDLESRHITACDYWPCLSSTPWITASPML